ncbi:MBL fold metallo-hydrolase [Streptomyces sp. NPDC050703]|uniref:MBL fold metallo-hydrolase n=1 Tax=Streptomyces sp. NPDC050703 TaxID=3157218 RepID=UPI003449DC5A
MTEPNQLRPGHRPRAPRQPRTTEIADGVFACVPSDDGRCPANAGIITGPEGVTVIDAVATAARARAVRAAVESLRAGPVRRIVHTHHHGGRTHGDGGTFPGATVIAHALTRSEMAGAGPRPALPSVTFDERLTLHSGDRSVELVFCGPAHTTNDVVVWLPGDRVLFTGDVVLAGTAPCTLMGSVEGALRAVGTLRALGARTVVCGRGPIRDARVLDETESYLRWVQVVAMRGWQRGLTPSEMAGEALAGPFGHPGRAERLVGNLRRAYAELDGGPLGRPLEPR